MTTNTREALAALMVIAAECAQRKPLQGFEELTEATHIGHRQFGRAHEKADEDVRMLAVRLRAVFDTLAAALATQPAQPRVWDEFGRTNAGDQTGGAVQRFGFDISGSKPDIIPATNGAFVYYDDYLALHRKLAAQPSAQGEAVATPAWWLAVLDAEQRPHQLQSSMHEVACKEKRSAEAFIAEQLDFNGWRYTLQPLYASAPAAPAQAVPMRRASDGWVSNDGGLSWRNPAPHAAQPINPSPSFTVAIGAAHPEPSAQGEAVAWLVEWKAHGHGPQWWGFNHTPGKNATWCSDANNAIRFARKEDAERMRLHVIAVAGLTGMHSYERSVSVTEHLWEGYCRAA